ncbi:hypothetical protein NDU88_000823 [Pleurodeles waltl]|uniref:Secreted protein n=2 Tax=Pleurodeles waltl TaxID=8319 RepID=A0AAV7MLN6_PLEWA|nr:hypothetical protein NDU88_000823 [Pleurodeles waltl]
MFFITSLFCLTQSASRFFVASLFCLPRHPGSLLLSSSVSLPHVHFPLISYSLFHVTFCHPPPLYQIGQRLRSCCLCREAGRHAPKSELHPGQPSGIRLENEGFRKVRL